MESRIASPGAATRNPAADTPAVARGQPGRARRWLRRIAIAAAVLMALALLAQWLWLNSGSNRWELAIDDKTTRVYTLKSPGSVMLKVKGVTRSAEFTLANHLAPFVDRSIEADCGRWVEGCLSYKVVEPYDPVTQRNLTLWTVALFPPFLPREFLLQGQLVVDPRTKVVTLENIAVPNRLPPSDCCVRLSHVHNVWRYEPMPDGSVAIEFVSDLDMGGAFPKFLLNLGAASAIHKMLTEENPALLRQAKYRNATLDFIDGGQARAPAARP